MELIFHSQRSPISNIVFVGNVIAVLHIRDKRVPGVLADLRLCVSLKVHHGHTHGSHDVRHGRTAERLLRLVPEIVSLILIIIIDLFFRELF